MKYLAGILTAVIIGLYVAVIIKQPKDDHRQTYSQQYWSQSLLVPIQSAEAQVPTQQQFNSYEEYVVHRSPVVKVEFRDGTKCIIVYTKTYGSATGVSCNW